MASTLVHDRTYLIRQLDKGLWWGTETKLTEQVAYIPIGLPVRASSLDLVVDSLFPDGFGNKVHVTIEAIGLSDRTNKSNEKEQTV